MQRPTCTRIRIRTPSDARVIFHAVFLGILPMVSRRLDTEERRAINSGCVYVWEERGPNAEATGLGIERWTDGIRWGPSRVRDEFLLYTERKPDTADMEVDTERKQRDLTDIDTVLGPDTSSHARGHRDNLVKQTYSVWVDTQKGRRKWHLIAYFTQESHHFLLSISDIPDLASIRVPLRAYPSARRPPTGRDDPTLVAQQPADLYGLQPTYSWGPAYSGRMAVFPPSSPSTGSDDSIAQGPRPAHANLHNGPRLLPPLEYLLNVAPLRRHPADEEALMSFRAPLTL